MVPWVDFADVDDSEDFLPFREDKATQVASRFIEKEGGSIRILKLVKLVYLTDRTSLLRFGRPVTFDEFYSLPYGPIPSSTLDRINSYGFEDSVWKRFISLREGNTVRLVAPANPSDLSKAEVDLIDEVWDEYGRIDVVEYSHQLPEWEHPQEKGRLRIRYADILKAEGWPADEISELLGVLKAEKVATDLLG